MLIFSYFLLQLVSLNSCFCFGFLNFPFASSEAKFRRTHYEELLLRLKWILFWIFAVQLFFILTSFHLKILTHKICETIFWDTFQLPIAFFLPGRDISFYWLLAIQTRQFSVFQQNKSFFILSVPLFTTKDLSLSCKASPRALLPRPLRTDVRMRLIALQWRTRSQRVQQDIDHGYISFSTGRLWQAGI